MTSVAPTNAPRAGVWRRRAAALARATVHAVFWPWNLLFSATVLIGVTPLVVVDLVADAISGQALWSFVLLSGALVAVPVASTVLAFLHLRRSARDLLLLFFGVELPVFFALFARLLGLDELSGAANVVVVALVVGSMCAALALAAGVRGRAPSAAAGALVFAGVAVLLVAGAYAAVLFGLWSLPTFGNGVVEAVAMFFDSARRPSVAALSVAAIPAAWFLVAVVAFLTLPITAVAAWLGIARRAFRAAPKRWWAVAAAAGAVVVVVVAFFATLPTPVAPLYARIDAATASGDVNEQRAILAASSTRRALVDAGLARYRFIANDDGARSFYSAPYRRAWSHIVGDDAADAINEFGVTLARPFVFPGSDEDSVRARTVWRGLFGGDFERDNADAVRAALSSTWLREQRYAGFINAGAERVWLARQDVAVAERGGVAVVDVHDEWVNLTPRDEEVALFFELPEHAAVTGLWLSPDGDRAHAFAAAVAPRGAAQQVYREQVQQRRDPALLEQVGPRQYRLRVFPVPARPQPQRHHQPFLATDFVDWWDLEGAPRQHVWLQYEVFVDAAGHVAAPRLREQRNGFATRDTVRTHNGQPAAPHAGWVKDGDGAVFVDAFATGASAINVAVDDTCVRFARSAAAADAVDAVDVDVVDVVIDRSLTMAAHTDALRAALRRVQARAGHVRVVLATTPLGGGAPVVVDAAAVDVDALFFYGAAPQQHLLADHLRAVPTPAPLALVLTAGSNFDVATDEAPVVRPAPTPGADPPQVFFVHIDGTVPTGYDDATLDAVRRSGGGAVVDVDAAFARVAGLVVDDLAVTVVDGACSDTVVQAPGIAARAAILVRDRAARGEPAPEELDALHALAKRARVVTPYSSMICLVDEAQRQRLKQLEEQSDRFAREVESGAEADAPGFDVGGVPEPHEWALLIAALAAVLVLSARTSMSRSSAMPHAA
jgi:putative PEP-CTERM system integral membrane protein